MTKRFLLAIAAILPMHSVCAFLTGGVLLLAIIKPAMSQSSPNAVQHLLDELPTCSVLRAELQRGEHGSGGEQPYMLKMRQLGVQRAIVELDADLHGNRPENIRIMKHLYFRAFDGPNAQINDPSVLTAIRDNGLQAELDESARERVSSAPVFRGPDSHGTGEEASSFVEFFSDPEIPDQKVLLFPSGRPKALTVAVVNGDAVGTRALLKSRSFSKRQLNRALFDAVLSRYDNTEVIDLLLHAGADVNARAAGGVTPLMNSVAHPCNLRPLLDAGADVRARDKWGRDALQLAREVKQVVAIRLLQQAAANKRIEGGR